MSAQDNNRIFSKDFFLLFTTNFVSCGLYFLMVTMMAGYAIANFACSEALAGWAASIFMVGAVIGRPISGNVPRHLCRRVALACIIVMTMACVAYFFTSINYFLLLLVRLIHGLTFGIAGTLFQILIIRTMPAERLGEGVGYYTLSVTLGTAVGPMMGLLVVNNLDYNVLFTGCTIACVLATIAFLFVSRDSDNDGIEEAKAANAADKPKRKLSIYNIVDKSTWKFSVYTLIMGIAYAPLNAFLSPYATELGMPEIAPFIFLVYAAVLVISRPMAGKLLDKHGPDFVLPPTIIFMGIGLLICSLANSPIMLLSVGIFMALGFGTTISCAQATVTKMTLGTENTTMAVSTTFFMADVGNAIGPLLMGVIATATDYRLMFLVCALTCVVTLIYYHLESKSRA